MSPVRTLVCSECGQPLYVGQPMRSRGRRYHAHVGCAVFAGIRSRYGGQALQDRETLPPHTRRPTAA